MEVGDIAMLCVHIPFTKIKTNNKLSLCQINKITLITVGSIQSTLKELISIKSLHSFSISHCSTVNYLLCKFVWNIIFLWNNSTDIYVVCMQAYLCIDRSINIFELVLLPLLFLYFAVRRFQHDYFVHLCFM